MFTHIIGFQRGWRRTVVSQKLCDGLSQAGGGVKTEEGGKGVGVCFVHFCTSAMRSFCKRASSSTVDMHLQGVSPPVSVLQQ